MNDLPTKVIWFKDIERPKTLWLLKGLEELNIPIQVSDKWIKQLKPPRNRLGPYIYPIEFVFGEKSVLAMYDIGTQPKHFYTRFMRNDRIYFKIHIRNEDRKRWQNCFVAPNSPSRLEFADLLPGLRFIKDQNQYVRDFLFVGWHDDRGMRMATCKVVNRMQIESLVGLLPFKHHTKVPKYILGERMEYHTHLIEQARTKLNLALPGGFQLPYCSFRHVELWGVGAAVFTVKEDSVLVGNPRGIYIEYDLNNLKEQIRYYLEHDEEREAIAAKGREYFDKYLTPKANAEYIIHMIKTRMLK